MIPDANQLRVLKAEIKSDLKAIERIDQSIREVAIADMEKEPPKVVRSGLALYLHHFYQAVEQIFLRITKTFDHFKPAGDAWHKDLINNMSLEIEKVRPAVISEATRQELERYRSFRHVVRHAYERDFIWKAMKDLVVDYPRVSAQFKSEIETFFGVIDEMIRQLESDNLSGRD